jgi:hypothetical protein
VNPLAYFAPALVVKKEIFTTFTRIKTINYLKDVKSGPENFSKFCSFPQKLFNFLSSKDTQTYSPPHNTHGQFFDTMFDFLTPFMKDKKFL